MCLAILYAEPQDAPFLRAVRVQFVYAGAILMLFPVRPHAGQGVDSSDSLVETIRGQRWLAVTGALLFGILLLVGVSQITLLTPTGLDAAQPNREALPALAQLLFSTYVFAFEVTSALLITAAVGAMVLAHRERLGKKVSAEGLHRAADEGVRRRQEAPRPGDPARCVCPPRRGRHPGAAARRLPRTRFRSRGCWSLAAISAHQSSTARTSTSIEREHRR